MKWICLSSIFLLFSCSHNKQSDKSIVEKLSIGQWIDLTYEFSDKTIYWPTANPFKLDTVFEGISARGYYYASYNFCAAEHGGTHLDAPLHFVKGKWGADEIPLEKLTGEAAVIDVSAKALKNPDYLITQMDIAAWEKLNGRIADDAILLFYTGFGSFYPDAKKYLGTDERGTGALAKLHFPGIHPGAAAWLVVNRKIKAVGIDAASIDYGQTTDFKTHQVFYEKNIPGFENVASLDQLPAKGAFIVALPMKIKGGSGGPLRIIAWITGKR